MGETHKQMEKRGKKSDVKKRSKEMKLESDKMRHMHLYGMITGDIMQLCFFFSSFVSFLVFAHGLALLAEQQSFLTLHICASTVWPNSPHFLKTKRKMEFS